MIKVKSLLLVSALITLNLSIARAGIAGDINSDGKIDLIESIYALQVASGSYPLIPSSCVLTGKGSWQGGGAYIICDVVEFGGLTYANVSV